MSKRRLAGLFGVVLLGLVGSAWAEEAEESLVGQVLGRLESCGIRCGADRTAAAEKGNVEPFRALVRSESWTEQWPADGGGVETRDVTGEIWTAAIQAAIDKDRAVYVPARATPYYLDGPLVLGSGCRLIAAPGAEFRLKPGVSTCMVRNAYPVSGQAGPVVQDAKTDSDITVEGGVWTTLRTRIAPPLMNGNSRGRLDARDSVSGGNGVLCFSNVRGLCVRGITVRQSTPFAVHLTNVSCFLVEDVTMEEHGRDGVHLNGPCWDGVIRVIRGVTHDDFVAMNAWDWKNCAPTFGPIERIVVEKLLGTDRGCASIRLLPGSKKFADGTVLDCAVRDCVFREILGLPVVKMYAQPNLELGAANDYSATVGRMSNLVFRGLRIPRAESPGTFQIHADVDGLRIEDVCLDFVRTAEYRLVSIGPQSMTYCPDRNNPATWVEIFAPDKDCTVRHLTVKNVRERRADGKEVAVSDPDSLVGVVQLKMNPDYPASTPRGGTGKGIWIRP